MAANSPIAVANSASAMPGATTASEVFCSAAMLVKLRMMPQTVPNRPTKGATAPIVARMLSRSPSRSISSAAVAPIVVASRSRVPSRSMFLPAVERRHSAMPAPSTLAAGRSLSASARWKRSMSSAAWKSRSNFAERRRTRPKRKPVAMMIAQVQMLASNSPSMTAFTT